MTLEERRNRSDLIEMFKISKGISAIPWNSFFRADHTKRTRGHSRKVVGGGVTEGLTPTKWYNNNF